MRASATAARRKRCGCCVRKCRRKEHRQHEQQHRIGKQLTHHGLAPRAYNKDQRLRYSRPKKGSEHQLFLRPDGWQCFWLGTKINNELLQHQALACRIGTQCQVCARKQTKSARKLAPRLVTPRLSNHVLCRKRRQAEALPECVPDCTRIANVLLENHQHLPKCSSEHVDVT